MAVVDEVAGALHIILGEMFKRGAFLEVLSEQAVGVFDGAFLPRVEGAGEKGVGFQDGGDDVMASELASVVEGDCLEIALIGSPLWFYTQKNSLFFGSAKALSIMATCERYSGSVKAMAPVGHIRRHA